MTQKILIIGAGGLLGSLLLKKLNRKYLVTGTSKQTEKKSVIKCDITKKEDVFRVIQKVKPNIIVHLAGITGNIECENNPHRTLETNVMGTYYILNAIKDKKIRLIFASSREVYGFTKNKVKESSPLQPINMNGITKLFSENLIRNFHVQYKIGYSILRFTNFYGEHNEKRGISKMLKDSLIGNKITIFGGNQKIDLLHFDDAVEAIVKTIESKKNGVFNIGYGKSITLMSLINTVEKISKTKVNFKLAKSRNIEVQKFAIDVSKARHELDFEAKISPKIGIKRMMTKWIKK